MFQVGQYLEKNVYKYFVARFYGWRGVLRAFNLRTTRVSVSRRLPAHSIPTNSWLFAISGVVAWERNPP